MDPKIDVGSFRSASMHVSYGADHMCVFSFLRRRIQNTVISVRFVHHRLTAATTHHMTTTTKEAASRRERTLAGYQGKSDNGYRLFYTYCSCCMLHVVLLRRRILNTVVFVRFVRFCSPPPPPPLLPDHHTRQRMAPGTIRS